MIDYTYKDLFLRDSVNKQLKIEVEDGTVITNEDIWSESMSIDESLCSESSLTFGCCESSEFRIKIANRFDPMIGQWLTVSMTMTDSTGPFGTSAVLGEAVLGSAVCGYDGEHWADTSSEDNPFIFGHYKVQSDQPTGDRTYREIVAYDAMYDIINADKELVANWYEELLPDDSSTVTMREFRDSFITLFGLEVVDTNLCNDSMIIEKTVAGTELSGEYILESICEINGCFGHITRDGKFQFVTIGEIVDGDVTFVLAADDDSYLDTLEYGYTPTAILGKAITGYAILGDSDDPEKKDTDFALEIYGGKYGQKANELKRAYEITCTYEDFETQRINKVQIREEDRDIGAIVGTGDNCYVIENNLFTYGKDLSDLEKIAESIYDEISVITYRPATIDAKGNPCYEVGDAIKLETKYETIYTIILNRSLTGIQNLRDEYVADGVETYADNSVGLNASIEQLKGQTNTLTRTVDETTFQISNIYGDLSEIQMTINSISFTVTSEGTKAQYDYLDCQNFSTGELPEDWEEYHNVYGTYEYFIGNNSSSSGLPEGWETYTQSEYNTGTALATDDAWLGSYCRIEKTDSERGQFGIHRRVPITGTWSDKDLSGTLSIKCKIAKPDDSPENMTVVLGFTKGGMGYYSTFDCYSSGWLQVEYTRESTTLASGEYIYIDICTAIEGAFYVTDIEATLDGEILVSEDFSGSGKYDLGSCAKITKTTEGSSLDIYPSLIYDLGELSSGDYRIRFKAMTDAGYAASASVRYGVYPSDNEEDGIFNIAKGLKSTEWTTIEAVVTIEYWSGSIYFSIGAYETNAPIYITDIEFLYPAEGGNVTGILGGTASITMNVGDEAVTADLDLTNVRQSFADDTSSIVISAGTILFASNTILISSDNLTVEADGTIIASNGVFYGTIASVYGHQTAFLTAGGLRLYYDDFLLGSFYATRYGSDEGELGSHIGIDEDGAYFSIGKDDPETGMFDNDYFINYSISGFEDFRHYFSGAVYFYDDVDIAGIGYFYDDVEIQGELAVGKDTGIFGDFLVYGESYFMDYVRMYENLRVDKDIYDYGDATVFGDATIFEGAMIFEGAEIYGGLAVSGKFSVSSDSTVSGDLTVSNNLTVSNEITGYNIFGSRFILTGNYIWVDERYGDTIFYRNTTSGYFRYGDSDIETDIIGGSVIALDVYNSGKITANKEIEVSSDERLKHDIENIDSESKYLKMLDTITPVRFKYNRYDEEKNEDTGVIELNMQNILEDNESSAKYHLGYIAQNVISAAEEAGLSEDEVGFYDKDAGSGYAGLAYGEIIPLLHLKIKQLESRIEQLEHGD